MATPPETIYSEPPLTLVPLALPPMRKPADLAAAMEAIAAAVARGLLAPAEAAELAKVVDTFANAIEVRDLRKSYGEVEAVRGVSFEVARGEVFCLLGPNGAGKTSIVEILEAATASQRNGGERVELRELAHV